MTQTWLTQLFLVALWEEIGWRHWLLRYFGQASTPAKALIFTGVIWTGWHLPKFALLGTQAGWLLLLLIGANGLLCALWWWSRGDLWSVAMVHAAINASFYTLASEPGFADSGAEQHLVLVLAVLGFGYAVLVCRGQRNQSTKE
ncbi:CPBP family intramembrane glutamic endopeptidase [Ferrimonas marina]|uniref:CAAX protease self-immunity n=1 Tax=Ferrimonas marina TaxID=299255 RepID=A0A1M5NCN5_9GAMM|nr:CPBP family intramembrane glutamic endopeptidase [Ferrimonas marina]SHG87334.1 CAAX protease self-immunity [Ferrimonas marina]